MTSFKRDRFTWMAYLMFGVYGFLQAALGPLMPFLRRELALNYTLAGLHFSAFALGIVLASLTNRQVAARVPRLTILWAAGGLMVAGAVAFTQAGSIWLTLPSIMLTSMAGNYLIINLNTAFSDRFGPASAIAYVESNVAAGLAAAMAGAAVGTFQVTTLGWRGAIFAAAACGLAILLLFFRFTRVDVPPYSGGALALSAGEGSLPRTFWLNAAALFLIISTEWSVIYWAADFLAEVRGFPAPAASGLVSVYFGSYVLIRVVASRLVRGIPLRSLLIGSVGVAAAGFAIYWLVPAPGISALGLFITGCGLGGMYPLGLSACVAAVPPEAADRATARAALMAGLAILIMPQVLGTLADFVGILAASAVVPALMAGTLALLLAASTPQAEAAAPGRA